MGTGIYTYPHLETSFASLVEQTEKMQCQAAFQAGKKDNILGYE